MVRRKRLANACACHRRGVKGRAWRRSWQKYGRLCCEFFPTHAATGGAIHFVEGVVHSDAQYLFAAEVAPSFESKRVRAGIREDTVKQGAAGEGVARSTG